MSSEYLLSIPEELILMLLNEQTGYFYQVQGWTLNCVVSGAVLADLSLRTRIDTDEESLFLVDSTKTGEPVLDMCLEEIVSHPHSQDTHYWIERLALHSENIIETTLKRLVDLRILTHHDGEFYTMNRSSLQPKSEEFPDSESPGQYIRTRIEGVIFDNVIPNPRDSLIIGLLKSCDIIHIIFELDEEKEKRIDWICKMELINRAIASSIGQTIIAPSLRRSPLSKTIPRVSVLNLVSKQHFWDGNLPALFAAIAGQYGPVFQLQLPFQKPLTFLAGAKINRWAHRNARKYLTSGNYFRELEQACGAQGLISSLDGADHFRLRKVMSKIYSAARFVERLGDMYRLTRQFMSSRKWETGSEIEVRRDARLLTNLQMTQLAVSTDSQDIFEELVEWQERASICYVGHILPKFMARTPVMKKRFQLLGGFARRIEQNHTPFQRTTAIRELADDLISLHNNDPQILPEQNLAFTLAAAPTLQSIYLGDLLGFALFEMVRHPQLAARIREEANALFDGGDPGKEEFTPETYDVTRRFLMECLRLYPIVSMQVRNVANSCTVEDFSLPLGERVHIVQTATHYMSDSFPDPYKFDIDRYLPARKEHRDIAYAPYGLGTHMCVGFNWMNLQMIVTLLMLTYYFEFEPLPKGYKLKIAPFPTLSVTKNMRVRIANGLRELPA